MNKRSIFSIRRYIYFFLLIAFVVTVSFLLFFHSADFTMEMVRENAVFTFLNVLALSFIFCAIDKVQRRYTIEKPVKSIQAVTEKLAKGDFSVRAGKVSVISGRDEFDEIAENIDRMAADLAGIETLRTDFVSNVSHELKTPLAVIKNYATMLQEDDLSDEKRVEYAAIIANASQGLSELITNILRLNKLENQQIYPKHENYSLGNQLVECLLGFEEVWEEKEIEIDSDIDEEVMISGDEELWTLVWNNLLSNAFKFTPKGGCVKVNLREDQSYAVVEVIDSGCGISKEEGKHIFDKFYQGDTSHATKGNGLGLALVKRVIDICGAKIEVDSQLGKGTHFTVYVPKGDL